MKVLNSFMQSRTFDENVVRLKTTQQVKLYRDMHSKL